jgi:hypothetical protein
MKIYSQTGTRYFVAAGALGSLLLAQGCIATRDWVKEQMDPLSNRVSTNEQKFESQIGTLNNRTNGIESKLGQFEGRLGQYEGRLGQVDAKTDKALNTLANLRLERRFVIDMKEGANFAFNRSSSPSPERNRRVSQRSQRRRCRGGHDFSRCRAHGQRRF